MVSCSSFPKAAKLLPLISKSMVQHCSPVDCNSNTDTKVLCNLPDCNVVPYFCELSGKSFAAQLSGRRAENGFVMNQASFT